MSVAELKALARRHWKEWLPEKVKELKAEGKLDEALMDSLALDPNRPIREADKGRLCGGIARWRLTHSVTSPLSFDAPRKVYSHLMLSVADQLH